MRQGKLYLASVLASAIAVSVALPARAETMMSAMSYAYSSNPTLNAARAEARAVDEGVAQALSGWRPTVTGEASIGQKYTDTDSSISTSSGSSTTTPGSVGVTVNQPLFRGYRTVNSTKQAEAAVRAAHESLRNTEQNVLLQAAQAYADVVRDSAIVQLRNNNLSVLQEQLKATQDRFEVGEVTRTDTAQARARVSAAQSQMNAAQAQLLSSRAVYIQIIGREPKNLKAPQPFTRQIPASLDQAIAISRSDHPAIKAARYSEESAAFAIKVAEGALLPTLSLQGSMSYNTEPSSTVNNTFSAQILGVLTVPIYQGGSEYSQIREAKQTRSQRMLEVDVARAEVQAAVLSAWGGLQAARASILSAQAQIDAASIALDGVREEARVGQRTTLDVLDAQQELLDARVSRVIAERDQVVASVSLYSALGRLLATRIGLSVREYKPETNARQVRDKWFGLRTSDGQ
ncbi:MAG: TolC family outer membrane protein [Rhodobiaceae bacterium]|nr:TolC family outer membrane protein [Rhodobiaceae bacterium]MCC0047957.1 TolC family outer membrane protein [Rhodobiaceae bacterium]